MLRYAEKKNVKLTNWRHPYLSHFCWMVWGAGKFVVKTARVYRVNESHVSYFTHQSLHYPKFLGGQIEISHVPDFDFLNGCQNSLMSQCTEFFLEIRLFDSL